MGELAKELGEMAGEILLATTTVVGLIELRANGRSATANWNELVQAVTTRLGEGVASLFGRPAATSDWPDSPQSFRWYCSTEGYVVGYAGLDDEGRRIVDDELRAALLRLQPLLASPDTRELLEAALQIPSMANIFVVGGKPVLTGWGFVPKAAAANPASLAAHFAMNLGKFRTEAPAQATVQAQQDGTPQATPGLQPRRRWLAPTIASTITLVVLVALSFPGVLLYAVGSPTQTTAIDPALTAEVERSLEQQIDALKRKLAEPPSCSPSEPRGTESRQGSAPPLGRSDSTSPPPPGAASTSAPPRNPNPSQPHPAATASAGNRALSPSDLLSITDQATVFVVAPSRQGDKVSIGSAFFINDRQLVTNRHVIENGDPNRVILMNTAIGRLNARVLASTSASTTSGDDFAILETASPVQVKPLALSLRAQRLDPVVAAGYPQMVLETDQAYQHLMEQGSTTSIPQMSVSQGVVTALQQSPSGTALVVHSATISPGNSGGPLVDACGRAIGVNTFGRTNASLALTVYFALGSSSLAKFLEASGFNYTELSYVCGVAPSEGPTAGTDPAAAPAPAPALAPVPTPSPTPSGRGR